MTLDKLDKELSVPDYALKVSKILKNHGYQAYIVGGWVRDMLLGNEPKDIDVATDATPEEMVDIFIGYKIIPTGEKYGTMTVMMESVNGYIPVEVTTFRFDGDYNDGRRPDNVEFTRELSDDLIRRDFRVNTFSYDCIDNVILSVPGAMSDLENGSICAVGNPSERFTEDALRMLRGCRFASKYGFNIDHDTKDAIINLSHTIENVSMERVRDEIVGILEQSPKPSVAFELMRETGLLGHVLPELEECHEIEQPAQYHKYDVYWHILHALDAVPIDYRRVLVVRLSALMHDIGKPVCREWSEKKKRWRFIGHEKVSALMASEILKRLKFSNDIINRVIPLVRMHMLCLHLALGIVKDKTIRKMMVNFSDEESIQDLLVLTTADAIGSGIKVEEDLNNIRRFQTKLDELKKENGTGKPGIDRSDLAIDGNDILKLGVEHGPDVGNILETLLERVLSDPAVNDKETLLRFATMEAEKLKSKR